MCAALTAAGWRHSTRERTSWAASPARRRRLRRRLRHRQIRNNRHRHRCPTRPRPDRWRRRRQHRYGRSHRRREGRLIARTRITSLRCSQRQQAEQRGNSRNLSSQQPWSHRRRAPTTRRQREALATRRHPTAGPAAGIGNVRPGRPRVRRRRREHESGTRAVSPMSAASWPPTCGSHPSTKRRGG